MVDENMKIYAFPYAFGGANIYNQFKGSLDSRIKFKSMNYPGHEDRFAEDLLDSITLLAEDAYTQMKPELKEDYYLLGYSMGGYVCVELYHIIMKNGMKPPKGIILLSVDEPMAKTSLDDKDLDNMEVIREILSENGNTDEEVIHDNELMELLAPIIKNDAIADRNYRKEFDENRIILCPVLLIKGEEDANADEDLKWKKYIKDLRYEVVKGDHFFLFNPNLGDEVKNMVENFTLASYDRPNAPNVKFS